MTNLFSKALRASVAWLHQKICVPQGIAPPLPPDSAQGVAGFSNAAPDPERTSLSAPADPSWPNLAEECVALFDELERNKPFFAPSGQELVEHLLCRIQEILQRSGVAIIADEDLFDRRRHQPVNRNPGAAEKARIIETISPGFAIDQRILRRAKVKLADNPPAPSRN